MTDSATPPTPQGAGAPSLQTLGQYVKDLSFENPSAPATNLTGKPQIQVGMDVQARPAGNDQYEVTLRVRVDAKSGEAQVYLAELLYAGLFLVKNIPAETLQPVLLIECPRILFPFARRIISDITRDGGFMPLMLDPIDFAALFRQQAQRAAENGSAQAPPTRLS